MLRLYFVWEADRMKIKCVPSLIRCSSPSIKAPHWGYMDAVSRATADDRRDKNDALRAKVYFSLTIGLFIEELSAEFGVIFRQAALP